MAEAIFVMPSAGFRHFMPLFSPFSHFRRHYFRFHHYFISAFSTLFHAIADAIDAIDYSIIFAID
jgi:hypothetical protein